MKGYINRSYSFISYAPPDESSFDLSVETAWLQGALFTSLAYGVASILFVNCFYLLLQQRDRFNRKVWLIYLIYISVIFVMGTLFFVSLLVSTQQSFINNRNYPGGPAAYEAVIFSEPLNMMGNAAYVIANWLADGLMVSASSLYSACLCSQSITHRSGVAISYILHPSAHTCFGAS